MPLRILKVALLGLTAVAGLLAGCSPIKWQRDYAAGISQATQTNRRALVQFYSHMNMDAQVMDNEVFSDPSIQRLIADHFVAIRVDDLLNRDLSRQFNVQVLPAFFVIRPDMTVAGSSAGKMDKDKFRLFLIKNAFN